MAENIAHLTQTAQSKPSIFDFIAHEALNDLLYPSAKKIIDILAFRNGSLVHFVNWFDEFFLLSHSLLQLYYLKKYGATFSEKFYGLQRKTLKNSSTLATKELYLSLLTVTLFPYLKMKLNKIADEFQLDYVTRTNERQKIIFMKSVIYGNSGLNVFYQLAKFIQHLRFISGKTDINSPLLWAAGVKLNYAEENPSQDVLTFRNFIPQLLQRSLEVGAFFIQFLQWWQTEKSGSLNIVPAPPPPQKSKDGIKYNNLCPICLKKREIETALSTSGFVFCFKCITAYLMEYNQCPVTKLPATSWSGSENPSLNLFKPQQRNHKTFPVRSYSRTFRYIFDIRGEYVQVVTGEGEGNNTGIQPKNAIP